MVPADPLGIIAGAGELPLAIARTLHEDGRPVFVLALDGIADAPGLNEFPHAWASLGDVGTVVRLLKEAGCSEVTLAGRVARPDFSKLKLDGLGAQYIARILAAAFKGDDALLRAVVSMFEKQGFRVTGTSDLTRALLAPAGVLGLLKPQSEALTDIRHGFKVVRALGALDVGQAAVVAGGLVLAVEAAEGTDAMLKRVAGLPATLRGSITARRGVLVKAMKPHQERRVDLPVIGARTIELASAAGLAGVAFQPEAVLILNRPRIVELANNAGLFVFGISGPDAAGG
ncbi:MAG: UDP-2,3-diacylglucosamine diphosphatase LpxI [Alphaproteobacteria bacterium]|nr:UDP-2,3-diacylglucosamine diphosphatase LpxI [Alphaproteobacteria bacterium]